MRNSTKGIAAEISKRAFRLIQHLQIWRFHIFRTREIILQNQFSRFVPVDLSSDNYYVFDKADLLRDGWKRKPAYGKADPTVVSEYTETYNCKVDQMIMGVDNIRQTDLQRRMGPAIRDPRIQRTRTIAEQANIHQDYLFAEHFFKAGVWSQEYTG